jgi:hypothetical protein
MKISFKRSGGFAGMRLSFTIDTLSLTGGEGQILEDLVEKTGFFDMPPTLPSPPGSVDRFQYQIVVETSSKHHAIDVGEAALPDSLRPLIDQLTRLARSSG